MVPTGCVGIIDAYVPEPCPICYSVLFDKTTTQVDTFYCEEQQSHVAHAKCAADGFRRKAASKGLIMGSDKDVLTLIGPAYECILCKKTEVETRTRRSQERKEPYPELLNVLQRSPSDTSNSVTLRELWRKAANISENAADGGRIDLYAMRVRYARQVVQIERARTNVSDSVHREDPQVETRSGPQLHQQSKATHIASTD